MQLDRTSIDGPERAKHAKDILAWQRPWLIFMGTLVVTVLVSAQQGWNDDTHGRNAIPDYERVFAQDAVKRLDIQVTAGDWERLMADMADMAGPFGAAGGGPGGGLFNFMLDPAAAGACGGLVEGSACSFGTPPQTGRCTILGMGEALACTPLPDVGGPGRGGGPGGGNLGGGGFASDAELLPRTPIYIPVKIVFDGVTFEHVGLRLKGNSSLVNSWRSGVEKLPFRLNFDELDARYPDIRDQTFFGFPNLNLTSNSQDRSFLRAKVVGDLFREAGVPAARTAFVRVFLDRGAGTQYLGLYTLVEVPDRPFLQTVFGSDEGNLYKPAGSGARLAVFEADDFPKKTNQNDEDWTDVQDMIAVLNESRGDPAVWRARLEARFSVSNFLRWLALNTMIGNTDAYGGLAHNYWLYGSPRHRDRLFFVPWDHDLAMNAGGPGGGGGAVGGGPGGGGQPGGGGPPGGGGGLPGGGGGAPGGGGGFPGGATTLDLFQDRVNASWPLIRYLMDDPVYRAAYRRDVEDLLNTVFDSAQLTMRLRTEYARITPYVIGSEGEQPGRTYLQSPEEFTQTVASLLTYVQTRPAAVRQALEDGR